MAMEPQARLVGEDGTRCDCDAQRRRPWKKRRRYYEPPGKKKLEAQGYALEGALLCSK